MSDAQETAICSFPGIIHISGKICKSCQQLRKEKYRLHTAGKINSLVPWTQSMLTDHFEKGCGCYCLSYSIVFHLSIQTVRNIMVNKHFCNKYRGTFMCLFPPMFMIYQPEADSFHDLKCLRVRASDLGTTVCKASGPAWC